MALRISDKMQVVRGSVIREMAEAAATRKGTISFANGNPSSDTFPVEDFATFAADAFREDPDGILQYGLSQGYLPLIDTTKERLHLKWGIDFEKNDLTIVSGGQQVCDFASKVLLNEGDVVIVEEPSFSSCYNTFRAYGAKLVGVPMHPDGMDIDILAQRLEEYPEARMIYVIPNFQNPTGYITSMEKRHQIYDLAVKYNVAIFEDDPYCEIRFTGEDLMPIKSFDTEGIVVYAGSYSKTMAPAFRLGIAVFDKSLTSRMIVSKQTTDVHSSLLFQYITNRCIKERDYEGHLEYCRSVYRKKSELMYNELVRTMHPSVRVSRPEGGLFMMMFLPEGCDSLPFVWEALYRGVVCVPGSGFMIDQDAPCNSMRLCYSTATEEEIVRGARILGELTQEWLADK
ncbi:MAG: PLP-dependent aminotransferase family protein [Mogibacterium sp.]|nr:PLP-dependent aminotransferase family protein [Mogibacterium sp.]